MNIKRILLISLIILATISCLSVASAGLFSNDVETSTFKIACPDGFHEGYSMSILPFDGDNLSYIDDSLDLSDDKNDTGIEVGEISKECYDYLMSREYKNSTSEDLPEGWSGSALSMDYKFNMDVTEDNMRIVSGHDSTGTTTTGVAEINGKYYHVTIYNILDNVEPEENAKIIKDIFSSLEVK